MHFEMALSSTLANINSNTGSGMRNPQRLNPLFCGTSLTMQLTLSVEEASNFVFLFACEPCDVVGSFGFSIFKLLR